MTKVAKLRTDPADLINAAVDALVRHPLTRGMPGGVLSDGYPPIGAIMPNSAAL